MQVHAWQCQNVIFVPKWPAGLVFLKLSIAEINVGTCERKQNTHYNSHTLYATEMLKYRSSLLCWNTINSLKLQQDTMWSLTYVIM